MVISGKVLGFYSQKDWQLAHEVLCRTFRDRKIEQTDEPVKCIGQSYRNDNNLCYLASPKEISNTLLIPPFPVDAPFMDLVEHLEKGSTGYQHIIILDNMTWYPKVFPFLSTNVPTIMKEFRKLFAQVEKP